MPLGLMRLAYGVNPAFYGDTSGFVPEADDDPPDLDGWLAATRQAYRLSDVMPVASKSAPDPGSMESLRQPDGQYVIEIAGTGGSASEPAPAPPPAPQAAPPEQTPVEPAPPVVDEQPQPVPQVQPPASVASRPPQYRKIQRIAAPVPAQPPASSPAETDLAPAPIEPDNPYGESPSSSIGRDVPAAPPRTTVLDAVHQAHAMAASKELTRDGIMASLGVVRAATRHAKTNQERLWLIGAAHDLLTAGGSRGVLRPGEVMNHPEMMGVAGEAALSGAYGAGAGISRGGKVHPQDGVGRRAASAGDGRPAGPPAEPPSTPAAAGGAASGAMSAAPLQVTPRADGSLVISGPADVVAQRLRQAGVPVMPRQDGGSLVVGRDHAVRAQAVLERWSPAEPRARTPQPEGAEANASARPAAAPEQGRPPVGPPRQDLEGTRGVEREARSFGEARAAAREFIGQDLRNAETGMVARVGRNNLDKMLSASAVKKSVSPAAHSQAVANVDRLFARATLGETHEDRRDTGALEQIHRFFSPMSFDGKPLKVKLTVKEYREGATGNRIYTVEAMDVEPQ